MLTFHLGSTGIVRAPWSTSVPTQTKPSPASQPKWFSGRRLALRETLSSAVSSLTGTRTRTVAPRIPAPPAIHWHSAVVVRRLLESPQSIALVLGSADGNPLPVLDPGQFIWLSVPTPVNERTDLKYSLWIAPQPDNWRITLRLVGGLTNSQFIGEASNFLSCNLLDGDRLEVGIPSCAPIHRKYLTSVD